MATLSFAFSPSTGKSFLTAGEETVHQSHSSSGLVALFHFCTLLSASWLTTIFLWCILNGKHTKAAAPTGTGLCEKVTARN